MAEMSRHLYSPVGRNIDEVLFDLYLVARMIHYGREIPEGNVSAPPGHIYLNLDGGEGAALWVKASGTGTIGWSAAVAGASQAQQQLFVADAEQTTFTVTSPYAVGAGSPVVYVNGIYQAPSAYSATDGDTVVLSEPLDAGDLVEIVVRSDPSAYTVFETTAIAGQSVFPLSFTYPLGSDILDVYLSGIRQAQGTFTETNERTVTLQEGLDAGVSAVFVYSELFASRQRQMFTAAADQTILPLGFTYQPGQKQVAVYINGVRQAPGAFFETDFETVTLSEGLDAGDTVEVFYNENG